MPTLSRSELATLGIVVDANGAIRSVDQFNAKLATMGTLGEQAAAKVSGQTAPALRLVEGSSNGAHVSMGRLKQSLESVATAAVGATPVVGKLAGVLGEMALGGGVVTGVLLGITAVAGVYDLLTSSSKKAREEADKMTASLVEQARAARAATLQGAQDLKLIAEINLQSVKSENIVGTKSVLLSLLTGKPTFADSDIEKHLKRVADAQTAVNQMDTIIGGMVTSTTTKPTAGTSGGGGDLSSQIARYNEFMSRTYGNLGKVGHDFAQPIDQVMAGINADVMNNIARQSGYRLGDSVSMPNVGINDGLTKEQIRTREKMGILVDDSNKNADKIKDAVWGSAATLANTIVGALNLGGGGKGSNLGGAIGGTAGFAVGFAVGGPIGGAIGSTLGNIAGSLLGGLFDHHKKAIDQNTDAIRNLTAALYNAPSGYKVSGIRNRADDGRQVYESVALASRMRSMRGGAGALFA